MPVPCSSCWARVGVQSGPNPANSFVFGVLTNWNETLGQYSVIPLVTLCTSVQCVLIPKKTPTFLLWAEPKQRLWLCSGLAGPWQVPCPGASVLLWKNWGDFILERHWQKAGLRKEGALGVWSEKPRLALGLGPFTTQAVLGDLDLDHSGVSLER